MWVRSLGWEDPLDSGPQGCKESDTTWQLNNNMS